MDGKLRDLNIRPTSFASTDAGHSTDLPYATKRAAHAVSVLFTITSATVSNASFASHLCTLVNETVTDLTIASSLSDVYYTLPNCLTSATSMSALYATSSVLVSNFAWLPPNLVRLYVYNSQFGPDSPLPNDGFDDAGNVTWSELWSALPQLTLLDFQTTNLRGFLPSSLPKTLTTFNMVSASISGSIPATLFSNASAQDTLHFGAASCSLTGTIPSDLFSAWSGFAVNNLWLSFSYNGLTGSIPADLFMPFQGSHISTSYINLGDNTLTGSLPNTIFPSGFINGGSAFSLDLRNNRLSGSFPSTFFGNLTQISTFNFFGSGNLITALPPQLFPNGWTIFQMTSSVFYFDLTGNLIAGALPAGLIVGGLQGNATWLSCSLYLGGNQITGTIPPNLFYAPYTSTSDKRGDLESLDDGNSRSISDSSERDTLSTSEDLSHQESSTSTSSASTVISYFKITQNLIIYLVNNKISGTLPGDIFDNVYENSATFPLASVYLSVAGNADITGTIPSSLFEAFPDVSTASTTTIELAGSNTGLSGSLPAEFCNRFTYMAVALASTKINGTIPNAWANSCKFTNINLSNNLALTGTIPSAIFTSNYIITFYASNTSLYGPLPAISTGLKGLDLGFTQIDFCGSDSSNASFVSSWTGSYCHFWQSAACGCQATYTKWCQVTCTPVAPPVASFPDTPVPSPVSPTCLNSSRPSLEFNCVGGVWVASSTNATTLVIPSGAGSVVVVGNLPSSSIIIQGLGTSVEVAGCAGNLTTIQLQLDPSELESLSSSKTLQTLITVGNSTCSSDLNNVAVSATVKSGCKKIKTQKVIANEGTTLGAFFTLDNSGCKTWWIILVSVICGLILVAFIVVVLLAVFYKPFRLKIRPYSAARKTKAPAV